MNIFGKFGQFIVNNQEIVQNIAILIVVLLCVIFLVFLYNKASKASKKKAESFTKIEGILEDINGNISQLRKQGDFIYIDNSSKKDHEQEALEEAMVLAKSGKSKGQDVGTVTDAGGLDFLERGRGAESSEESHLDEQSTPGCSDEDDSPASKADVLRESMIEKILVSSGRGEVLESPGKAKRKFSGRTDGTDKFGREYNVEEIEKQIRD